MAVVTVSSNLGQELRTYEYVGSLKYGDCVKIVPPAQFGWGTEVPESGKPKDMSTSAPQMQDPELPRRAPGIVIIEDETALATMIAAYLNRAGYHATIADTGTQGIAEVHNHRPDCVVLDLGLPDMDGLAVCQAIRKFSDCYIIMLTARGSEDDKITGLGIGADDYMSKPFGIRELITRIQTVMRRPRTSASGGAGGEQTVAVADIVLDAANQSASRAGRNLALTSTEFKVLRALAASRGSAVERSRLIEEVWKTSWVGDERVIDTHIRNLRKKLAGSRLRIETVRGIGYRVV